MSSSMSITLQADSDGFITFECPYCESSFKLSAGDLNDESFPVEELFCPYCGLSNKPNTFLSSDAIEAAKVKAYNYMAEMLNKEFGKTAKSINRRGSLIKMSYKPLKIEAEKEVKDNDTVEGIFSCKACERDVKVLNNAGLSKVFCPYCGVDI